MDVLTLMKEMPLRDVPNRLAALASVIDEANLELSRSVGMAFGAGYHELHESLEGAGAVYVAVEQALTEWRMDLKHNRQEELTEKPGEF
jgi:hypothetical protein